MSEMIDNKIKNLTDRLINQVKGYNDFLKSLVIQGLVQSITEHDFKSFELNSTDKSVVGPSFLLLGKTTAWRLKCLDDNQVPFEVWLPRFVQQKHSYGLAWWGGERYILPFLRPFNPTSVKKTDCVWEPNGSVILNSVDILEWFQQRAYTPKRQFKANVKKNNIKLFMQNLYWMITGDGKGGAGAAWMQKVDGEHLVAELAASTKVIAVEDGGFGSFKRINRDEARGRHEQVCDLHTPNTRSSGSIRHLCVEEQDGVRLGVIASLIPHLKESEPRRLLLACGMMTHAEHLTQVDVLSEQNSTPLYQALSKKMELTQPLLPGVRLLTAFCFDGAWNHEDGVVISDEAAKRLSLSRTTIVSYPVPWAVPSTYNPYKDKRLQGILRRGQRITFPKAEWSFLELQPKDLGFLPVKERWLGRVGVPVEKATIPWPAEVKAVDYERFDHALDLDAVDDIPRPHSVRGVIHLTLQEVARPAQVGDKLFNLHGNKGVISRILPSEQMPHTPEGRPVEVMVNPIGVMNRGNFGQLKEALNGEVYDSSSHMLLHMTGGSDQTFEALYGDNLWMRSLHEASRQSKLAQPKGLPAGLKVSAGLQMREIGLKVGEMNAWALSIRHSCESIATYLSTTRTHENALALEDKKAHQAAWRAITASYLDLESSQLSAEEASMQSETLSKYGYYSLKKQDSALSHWISDSSLGSAPYAGAEECLGQLSEQFYGSTRLLKSRYERPHKVKGSGYENLRRAPHVEWLLAQHVGASYRAVIVPAPDVPLGTTRVPWWVALSLYWHHFDDVTKSTWGELLSIVREGRLTDLIEGHPFDSEPLCIQVKGQRYMVLDQAGDLSPALCTVLQAQLERARALISRDPVLHFGGMWSTKIAVSRYTDHVIGVPPQLLTPLGGDYDGDTCNLIPLGMPEEGSALAEFCQRNGARVINRDGHERLFTLRDLNLSDELRSLIPADEPSLFPMEKDLSILQRLLKIEGEFLGVEDFERGADDLRKWSHLLCRSWEEPFELSKEKGDYSLVEGSFKLDHFGARLESVSDEKEENVPGWWSNRNLSDLPLFFSKSQAGAGELGGLYRRVIHEGMPSPDDAQEKQRDYVFLTQRFMERLQQHVLKFKKNADPVSGAKLRKKWNELWDEDSDLSDPGDGKPEQAFLFELIKSMSDLFDRMRSLSAKQPDQKLTPDAQLWLYGALVSRDIKLSEGDPRYLFARRVDQQNRVLETLKVRQKTRDYPPPKTSKSKKK